MTTALEGGEGSASGLGRSLPPGKTRYALYRRLGEAPGPVWPGAENLVPTGIRSPDRPARSAVAIPTALPGPREGVGTILKRRYKPLQYNIGTYFDIIFQKCCK